LPHLAGTMAKATDTDYNKAIASKLREVRKAKGYNNYEDFCWDNEFPTRTYFRMENGENYTMGNLLKILAIFDVTPEEFFKGIK
jgi:transcriptional regulator with XRE-family HTH domain